jgi:hypothetical protein
MAGRRKKAAGPGMDPELRERLEASAEHLRGCPKRRFDAAGKELDLLEHYEQRTPSRVVDGKTLGGELVWITRCLLCGGHRVTNLDDEGRTNGAEEEEEELVV